MDVKIEKKRLWIFVLISYGVTFLMGIFMGYGQRNGMDVSAFPSAQMMYPAAGVILAYLVTQKEKKQMPRLFFYGYMVITGSLILFSILSVFMPDELLIIAGSGISLWTMLVQMAIIWGSILAWIGLLIAGKEKREAYGLRWKNGKQSIFCIILFVGLYFARTALSCALSGQMGSFAELFTSKTTWMMLGALFINFFIVFLAFFGEEYGWRYYLQPFLQKKFGLRGGVILLGIVWGLWHLPVDFFYYSPENGLIAAVAQQITCITLGIFFAYAYMKTQNIWVPVILHFLNNNLVPIISGNYSADVLQNQSMSWGELPMALLVNMLFFGIFILAKEFREKE